jgi:toxin HigB-1
MIACADPFDLGSPLCDRLIADVALFPGWRFHPLKGELKGLWSVTITGNWRLVFRFEDGDALDVDLVDYH